MIPDIAELLRKFFDDDEELTDDERAELERDADIDAICGRIQRGQFHPGDDDGRE